jgi:DNA-binding NarL/FixJ family response regulator
MATVVLADDHALLRAGLRRILESSGHAVVAEVGDGLRVLQVLQQRKPEVLVLDLGLPGLHGLDVIRELARHELATRVLVLSAYDRDDFVVNALRRGAAGYLLKGCEADELVAAVAQVARGGYYVTARLSGPLARGFAGEVTSPPGDPYDGLTPREHETFQLMAEGATVGQIASRLYISVRTVETHRANVMRKLGLTSQTDVVLYALRRGLLSLDEGVTPARPAPSKLDQEPG